jgi:hypothetical protein
MSERLKSIVNGMKIKPGDRVLEKLAVVMVSPQATSAINSMEVSSSRLIDRRR